MASLPSCCLASNAMDDIVLNSIFYYFIAIYSRNPLTFIIELALSISIEYLSLFTVWPEAKWDFWRARARACECVWSGRA